MIIICNFQNISIVFLFILDFSISRYSKTHLLMQFNKFYDLFGMFDLSRLYKSVNFTAKHGPSDIIVSDQ